jgi:hypothetical protein
MEVVESTVTDIKKKTYCSSTGKYEQEMLEYGSST